MTMAVYTGCVVAVYTVCVVAVYTVCVVAVYTVSMLMLARSGRRQHQHTDCIYSQNTNVLHGNYNKMILAHLITNRKI